MRFHTELDNAAEAKQVLVYLGEQFPHYMLLHPS